MLALATVPANSSHTGATSLAPPPDALLFESCASVITELCYSTSVTANCTR